MSNGENKYILTEIWKARPAWVALNATERESFFNDKIGPFLGQMINEGAEILACALNDNDSAERMNYDYMAVWRLPNKAFSERVEQGAAALGFLDYFEQANFSGAIISPPELNGHMLSV